MVSVGTIIWLSSELMFFAALFASYFTIRSVSPELWAENTALLDVPFAAVNTTVLVLSSLTCQLGVFAAERGQVGRSGSRLKMSGWGLREWFILTYVMGAVFIAGQALEYATLVQRGRDAPGLRVRHDVLPDHRVPRHPRHRRPDRLHLVLGRTYVARKFTHEQAVSAIVVSYYWHFVDVVWIGLFATIYLIQ